MAFGQRKKSMVEIVRTPIQSIRPMALNTVRGESCSWVIWVLRIGKVLLVTSIAVGTKGLKPHLTIRYMTFIAVGLGMLSQKRKAYSLMHPTDIRNDPRLCIMAPGAITSNRLLVDIKMTTCTL
jgi:hypothetical protein